MPPLNEEFVLGEGDEVFRIPALAEEAGLYV
jgi:hypothetical protein